MTGNKAFLRKSKYSLNIGGKNTLTNKELKMHTVLQA